MKLITRLLNYFIEITAITDRVRSNNSTEVDTRAQTRHIKTSTTSDKLFKVFSYQVGLRGDVDKLARGVEDPGLLEAGGAFQSHFAGTCLLREDNTQLK